MKEKLSETPLFQLLQKVLSPYNLHNEYKWFTGYYLFRVKRKKLVFYLNPKDKYVIFGVSYRSTPLLDEYPFLKISADEVKNATIKRKIKKETDIQEKGISEIVKLVLDTYHTMWY